MVKIDNKQYSHPLRHFSILITTIALQNSHRLTRVQAHRRQLAKQWSLFISHSKEAQKRGLLFITNPFPKLGALALRASYFTTHLVCKKRKQSESTIGINKFVLVLADSPEKER